MDRFFLFNLSPTYWWHWLLGVDSVSLAVVGVGREKAKVQERKPEQG